MAVAVATDQAMMSAAGYVLLPDRGVLALHGGDVRPFLQGLISNDIAQVREDRAAYGALLTPQGKFLFDFFIVEDTGQLLLETEAARLGELQRRLVMYRLRSKVDIEDRSVRFAIAALIGDDPAGALGLPNLPGAARALDGGLVFVDPRLPRLGVRALLPKETASATLAALGFEPIERDAYERLRLTLGVPDGSRDLVVDKATLLESGFEELNGVDFGKGCFIGQELTARMKYRGLVRKRLLPVTFAGAPPPAGTVIRLGQREAGEMRSGIEGQGLALLRLEHVEKAKADGMPLMAGDTEILPVVPPWATP
jgi:folate-binding protein YgfZ